MTVGPISLSIDGAPAGIELSKTQPAAARAQAMSRINSEELLTLNRTALASVQSVLGHGSDVGRWITPRRWCPLLGKSRLDIDLRLRILDLMPDQTARTKVTNGYGEHLLEYAVLTLTRYLIVVRMGPAGTTRKKISQSLDPSYISDLAYYRAATVFAFALAKWLNRPGDVFTSKEGFLRIVDELDFAILSENGQGVVLLEVRRMHILFDRGWWIDVPGTRSGQAKITDVTGDAVPTPRKRKPNPHLPLPDAYISEMGIKSVWLIESLAPNLLQLAERIYDIWIKTDDGANIQTVQIRRRHRIAQLLASWEWKDAEGKIIREPPFPLRLSRWGKNNSEEKSNARLMDMQWPPRSFIDVTGLLGNVQLAHLFVVSLSTGGRRSETMDLRRDCVEYARDGLPYANGRTFKLVRRHDGELRDWVLPDLAVIALKQQVQLVQVVEKIGPQKPRRVAAQMSIETDMPDHLWVQVSGGRQSDRTQPLLNLEKAMQSFAKALCMDPKPKNQFLRPHRFRKTVARLAALALSQAPKVLMDVFGHKSIEMTLYYILCDKDLQADIEQVSRELRVMRAQDAVSAIVEAEEAGTKDVELGGYGGPAALMVQRAVRSQKQRLYRTGESWGANSVKELAEILTLQGKAWEVVRHGVICTKLPGTEAGPCNKSRGRPEPSKCQTDCAHRLEEAFLRKDVDASIASCVDEFIVAANEKDDLMQALWAGQIRAHIQRFSDLSVKWSTNPIVVQILADQSNAKMDAA